MNLANDDLFDSASVEQEKKQSLGVLSSMFSSATNLDNNDEGQQSNHATMDLNTRDSSYWQNPVRYDPTADNAGELELQWQSNTVDTSKAKLTPMPTVTSDKQYSMGSTTSIANL